MMRTRITYWAFLKSLFKKNAPAEEDDTLTGHDEADTGQCPKPADAIVVPDAPIQTVAPEVKRWAELTDGMRPYRKRNPYVKCEKVSGFGEAYRFWLRLCAGRKFTLVEVAGHIRYTLRSAAGKVEMTDGTGNKDIVAVIRFDVPQLEGCVKEIKFMNEKKERDENN